MGVIRFDGIEAAPGVGVKVDYEPDDRALMPYLEPRREIRPARRRDARLLRRGSGGKWEEYGPPIPDDVAIEWVDGDRISVSHGRSFV